MKITLAQLNFTVGDLTGNTEQILSVIREHAASSDLIVFSELAVTGYYPMDLVDRSRFIEDQNQCVRQIQEATRGIQAAVVLGFVSRNDGQGKPFHNSVGVFQDGLQVAIYHKQLLPTYNIFDEARHFEPGTDPVVWEYQGRRIGLLICEDGWNDNPSLYTKNPVAEVMAAGAEVLVSINASPSSLGKQQAREALFSALCSKYRVPLIYVNQVGGNDALVFDGHSFACNAFGQLTARLAGFEPEVATIALPLEAGAAPLAPVLGLAEDLMYSQIVLGLRDYVRKCGFRAVVIGSSGGIDSALTLALAVAALGKENVTAITMPSRFSSSGSVDDSVQLCQNLGIRLLHAPIQDQVDGATADFIAAFGTTPNRLTLENMQARIRGRILMEYSNHFGALVLSTGNKSELAVGYATLYGDMNGGLNLIGDLYKTEVYALARYMNKKDNGTPIPVEILTKEPSAELSDGQLDSDSLPPYPVLDAILQLYIEPDQLTEEAFVAQRALAGTAVPGQAQAVLQMVDKAEFKRRQAPPIIRVHGRAFGSGRQLPIAQQYKQEAQ